MRGRGKVGILPLDVGKSLGVDSITALLAFLNTLTEPGIVMCIVLVRRTK